MSSIVPAIIPENFSHLEQTLSAVGAFTKEVQIDIVDGVFVPSTSWPYASSSSPLDLEGICDTYAIEIDLMVENPETVLDAYVGAGVERVVVHIESTNDIATILEHHRIHSYLLGLALGNDTSFKEFVDHIAEIDFVQLMGIAQIGSQGQPFDARVLSRIKELKSLFPGLSISIDGSVNRETLPLLVQAGADRFVVGSALLSSTDMEETFKEFESIVKNGSINIDTEG